jgi:hypothetical protein
MFNINKSKLGRSFLLDFLGGSLESWLFQSFRLHSFITSLAHVIVILREKKSGPVMG